MGNHRQKLIHNSTVGRHSLITLSGSLASQVYSRMGVGVLNPEYNLHVSGSTYVLGYLGVGLGAAPPLYHLHAQESRSSNYIAYIQNNSNNSAHGVYIGSNGTGAGSYLLNVKNFLTITGEGKVGINTLSPAETFHISGSQRITQASSNTLGAGLEIWRYDASQATYHWMDGSGDYHVDNATNGSRHIIFNDGGVGEVRVGAGIRLNATGNRLGKTDNTGYSTMYGGGAYNTGTGVITYGNAHATEPNVIRFTRSGFVESMRIDTSGNIGVNNSNPSHQVELLGQNSRRVHLQNAYIGFRNPNYTSGAQNWGWGAFGVSNEDGVFLRRYISDSYPFASPYNDLLQVHSSGMLTFESYGLNTIFGDGTGRVLGADADGDLVELDMYKKSSSLTVLETTTTTSGSLYVSSFQEPVDTPINLQANTAFGPWIMSATSYKVGIVEGGTTLTLRDNPLTGVSGSSVIWEQTYNTPGVYTITPSVGVQFYIQTGGQLECM